MKKIVALGLVLLLLTGCTINMGAYYDDDKKIESKTNSYSLDEKEQLIEGQKIIGNVEFEGMDTIWSYEAETDMEIDITYLIKLSKGKAKLVLIVPDNTLTTIVEITPETELKDYATNTLSIKKGLNRIKLVAGKDTQLNFDIEIPQGEFYELGM